VDLDRSIAHEITSSVSKDTTGDGIAEQTTTYGYDATQQTNKTVWQGEDTDPLTGVKQSETDYEYNLQGRMSKAEIESDGDGDLQERIDYTYNDNGIRVSKTVTTDSDGDGDLADETPQTTLYLVDDNNPTGYTQVLQELDALQQVIRAYTLGLDVITQAEAPGEIYHLLYDGHGSTRGLVDALGLPLTGQIYAYRAYGNNLGFDPATALTTHLYSGEQFDQRIAMHYLRARYYDAATGRFNRLDPFFGRLQDPQSLHKYLYVKADPIRLVDPLGREGILAQAGGLAARAFLRTGKSLLTNAHIGASVSTLVGAGAFKALGGGFVEGGYTGLTTYLGLRMAYLTDGVDKVVWAGAIQGFSSVAAKAFIEYCLQRPQPGWKEQTRIFLSGFGDGVFAAAFLNDVPPGLTAGVNSAIRDLMGWIDGSEPKAIKGLRPGSDLVFGFRVASGAESRLRRPAVCRGRHAPPDPSTPPAPSTTTRAALSALSVSKTSGSRSSTPPPVNRPTPSRFRPPASSLPSLSSEPSSQGVSSGQRVV
jgi:RHS repeat-associated protein